MRVIFIIILVYKIIKAEDSESKYIDLLPEKEKQEFLEKISRRILEEIQFKNNTLKQSGEISEHQLNEHDAYVKRLLKEELQNLRKRSGGETNVDPDPKVSVIGLDKNEDINIEDRYVDLTLRTEQGNKKDNKRRVFTVLSTNNENKTDHDKAIEDDSDVDIQVKNFERRKDNAEETTPGEIESTIFSEDHQIKNEVSEQPKLTLSDNPLTTENVGSNKEIYAHPDSISHITGLISEEKSPEASLKSNETIEYADIFLQNNVSSKKPPVIYYDTTNSESTTIKASHIASSRVIRSYGENDLIIKQDNYTQIDNDTSSSKANNVEQLRESTIINVELSPATETTAFAHTEVPYVIETEKVSDTYQTSTEINAISLTTTKKIEESKGNDIDLLKGNNVFIPSENTKHDVDRTQIDLEKQHETKEKKNMPKTGTEIEEITTISSITQETKSKRKKIYVLKRNNDLTPSENTKHNLNKAQIDIAKQQETKNNTKKMPKEGKLIINGSINVHRQNEIEKYEHSNLQLNNNNRKEYQVYEISPDSSPYVKQKAKKVKAELTKTTIVDNMEQPYYVPIYNYSPNNAFYNSHNIYGPNNDKDSDKDHLIIKNDEEYKDTNNIYKDDNDNEAIGRYDKNPNPAPKPIAHNMEQPYYVPVYNYAPHNAFYNPHNIYGPNNEDDSDRNHLIIKNDDEDKDTNKKYKDEDENETIERDDTYNKAIGKDDNENSNNFAWDYYFYHDPNPSKFRFAPKKHPNSGKNEPHLVNLHRVNNYAAITNSKVNSNDFSKNNHYPQRKDILGLLRKSKTSRDKSETSPDPLSTRSSNFDPNFVYSTDSIRRIRQILFQTKNWSFIQPVKNKMTTTSEPESSEIVKPVSKDPDVDTTYLRTNRLKAITNTNDDRDVFDKYIDGKKRRERKKYKQNNREFRVPLRSDPKDSPVNMETKQIGKESDYDFMKKVIDMVSGIDIVPILQKLHEVDIEKAHRARENNNDLDVYVTVMSDLIQENNKALKEYDWLQTTVDLQSAIKKMIDVTEGVLNRADFHPSDLELLKYLVYLYKLAKEELQVDLSANELRAMLLPKSKKKKRVITESGLFNRVWLIRQDEDESLMSDDELKDFEEFLDDLQTALYDFHTSVKYISMVTTYKKQHWFDNLKQLYINSKRKPILEVILHMCTARLLAQVERTAENGLEDDFLDYVKKHEKEVVETKEELVFVLKLLEEIKYTK